MRPTQHKLKILSCLIVLLGLGNSEITYVKYPCLPPFLSSNRPYSFVNSPVSLFLYQERAAFAFEIGAGKYTYPLSYFPNSLFPWPEIEGFWRFKYNKIGISAALIDKYQYTIREEMDCVSPDGDSLGKGVYWGSRFIYALRAGVAYQFSSVFAFGFAGDINYGFFRYDFQLPKGVYWIPEDERHMQFSDISPSFNLGGVFISKVNYKIFEVFYESQTQKRLFDGALIHFIPARISVSFNLPVRVLDVGVHYYRRFGKYRVYLHPDTLGTIVTITRNDIGLSFLMPVCSTTKLYFAFYSLPLTYDVSSNGVGFGFGLKLIKKSRLTEILLIYETGRARELASIWRLTRYGIRLGFSL